MPHSIVDEILKPHDEKVNRIKDAIAEVEELEDRGPRERAVLEALNSELEDKESGYPEGLPTSEPHFDPVRGMVNQWLWRVESGESGE